LITIKEKLQKEVKILNIKVLQLLTGPFADYLQNPNLSMDRKIKYKAINYVIMGDQLYKKGRRWSLITMFGRIISLHWFSKNL